MNLWVSQKAGSFLTSGATISFSKRTLLRGASLNRIVVVGIELHIWKALGSNAGTGFVVTVSPFQVTLHHIPVI
jgi:hypothetical protein